MEISTRVLLKVEGVGGTFRLIKAGELEAPFIRIISLNFLCLSLKRRRRRRQSHTHTILPFLFFASSSSLSFAAVKEREKRRRKKFLKSGSVGADSTNALSFPPKFAICPKKDCRISVLTAERAEGGRKNTFLVNSFQTSFLPPFPRTTTATPNLTAQLRVWGRKETAQKYILCTSTYVGNDQQLRHSLLHKSPGETFSP